MCEVWDMQNLLAHIEASGITRAEWARRFEISQGTLADFISGRRTPGLALAFRIESETGGAVPAAAWVRSDTAA